MHTVRSTILKYNIIVERQPFWLTFRTEAILAQGSLTATEGASVLIVDA